METSLFPKDPFSFGYNINRPIQGVFHSHNQYEVYYFHGGKCNYLIGDKIYVLAPGDLIILNGMTLHCANVDPDYEYRRSTIHFDPVYIRPFLELTGAVNVLKPFQDLRNYRIQLRGQDKEEAERLLLNLSGFNRRKDLIDFNRFRLAFVDLLYFIYQFCQKPLEEKQEFPTDKEKHVQDIISFVESHYGEDLHMEQLERELHLSKYYLSKIFKDVTGVTIFDYLYQLRINQAKILFLLYKDMSVTEVCYQVGFKHLAHFSRMFKTQVGNTPEKFRKQMRT
ncbi:AraC family transcriptional regulator [Paenibacillus thalictri]|uniref:AraC family transcriptional regulator n=1 Tax=Paenibacillus thalictri TaxID=2527873 RepID=A0A4Q9DRP0_9BACL|nr:AraC family transcriptional regulator [Paenibacillus thalictri]TBL78311.1 AraC family transcriptional regulator [Paenibacillus thalictri]